MKGISRSEINQLMAIPEARQIIDAKFVELRLIFKDQLKKKARREQTLEEPMPSNIIRFPLSPRDASQSEFPPAASSGTNTAIIKIVDASMHRFATEKEQVKTFMEYFKNYQGLRKAVLDEFFLRILPYSNVLEKAEG